MVFMGVHGGPSRFVIGQQWGCMPLPVAKMGWLLAGATTSGWTFKRWASAEAYFSTPSQHTKKGKGSSIHTCTGNGTNSSTQRSSVANTKLSWVPNPKCHCCLKCMHENSEEPAKCKALADDYLECLHHRKFVSCLCC
eukprot:GHRR01031090.1.p2 GENE.GHRR01031090.1~~GHRR01031090.1.p2  ORF type:complete len:138 (-),score=15.86 GHRR01031090.1:117-530(-)